MRSMLLFLPTTPFKLLGPARSQRATQEFTSTSKKSPTSEKNSIQYVLKQLTELTQEVRRLAGIIDERSGVARQPSTPNESSELSCLLAPRSMEPHPPHRNLQLGEDPTSILSPSELHTICQQLLLLGACTSAGSNSSLRRWLAHSMY